MVERKKQQISRPDMIHILMQARNENLELQQDEISSDVAGFATVEESHIGKGQVKQSWTDDEIVA